MPTFEIIPLTEAIEATKVDTWLEQQFGQEHDSNPEEGGNSNRLYIFGNKSGRVYTDKNSISIFTLEEAIGLAKEIKLLDEEVTLYRIVPVDGSYETRN